MLCVPEKATKAQAYKYLYVRECIIRHLLQNASLQAKSQFDGDDSDRAQVSQFESAESEEFDIYLKSYRPYFIMAHDGSFNRSRKKSYTTGRPVLGEALALRVFIWKMMDRGYPIGLINETKFIDWKVGI